jgi:hypothetical protein
MKGSILKVVCEMISDPCCAPSPYEGRKVKEEVIRFYMENTELIEEERSMSW